MSRAVPILELAAYLFAVREKKSYDESMVYLKENSGSRDRWNAVARQAALLLSDIHVTPLEGNKAAVRLALPPNPLEEADPHARVPAFVVYASDESGLTALEEYLLAERARLGREHPRVVEAMRAKAEFEEWQEARRATASERHARLAKATDKDD